MHFVYHNAQSIIILSILLNLESSCNGFKIASGSDTFKNAVERTVHREVKVPKAKEIIRPIIHVIDDDTYSPRIPSFDVNQISGASFVNPPALPLSLSIPTREEIPTTNKLQHRATCGLDDNPAEYWFHNKIHTFGNTGVLGMFHAIMAPIATALIDHYAYDGQNVRTMISAFLRETITTENARVLDLCCGVGISTRALTQHFKDAEIVVGMDTSPEMISLAKTFAKCDNLRVKVMEFFKNIQGEQWKKTEELNQIRYAIGNAERTIFPPQAFDLITIMYGFHEVPKSGRYRILREARRLLQPGGKLCVVDISPDFQPSRSMLAGEPYVLEYQQNIMNQLKKIQGFRDFSYEAVIKGHVGMWILTRK